MAPRKNLFRPPNQVYNSRINSLIFPIPPHQKEGGLFEG